MASLLEKVAYHEERLLHEWSEVEQETQQLIETARKEAAETQEAAAARLQEELSRLRREAAAQRTQEREAILAEAEKQIEAMRQDAANQAEAARQAVIDLVLPKQGMESTA